MKRITTVVCFLGALIALQGASVVSAKGPQGVANGYHNLSGSALSNYATDEAEICVFCHTPHGSSSTGPLWNKFNPAGPFVHYTTDTPAVNNSGRSLSSQSQLCMSCHDGVSSVNAVINLPNTRTLPIETTMTGDPDQPVLPGFGDTFHPVIDVDLTNDHPISFSYDDVLTHYINFEPEVTLHTVAAAQTAGVRFFGATNFVECSTCHDPHVDYFTDPDYTPFLITPNTGSNLCLACHIK